MTIESQTTAADAAITTTDDAGQAKRTFFLVKAEINSPATIAERITCDDIRQQLIVEQVDSRLTGVPVTIDGLSAAFPDVVKAAHYWSVMKQQAKADHNLRGPFKLTSTGTPSDAELLAWFASQQPAAQAAAPAPVDDVPRDLAETFVKVAEAAGAITPPTSRKKMGKTMFGRGRK